MSKFVGLLARYGPLFAAFALGVGAVVPAAAIYVNPFIGFLSFFGVTADPAIATEIGGATVGVIALVGVARKLYSLIVAYFSRKI